MASLRKGGSHHHLVVKGGLWWDYVQLEIAVRDGDRKQVKLLQAKAAKRRAATFKKLVRTQGS